VNTLLNIKELVAKQLGKSPDAIDENITVDKLGMDSFAVLELLFELEDIVGIAIPREALPREGTLTQLAAALDGLIATKAAAPK
jgi:acyl carrier protein